MGAAVGRVGGGESALLRFVFSSPLRYNPVVGRRTCEVMVDLPGGKRYSVMLEADSMYHAAVLFYAHCAAPPPGAAPPRIDMEAVIEIKPVYKVRLKDAMAWGNREANRVRQRR